MPVNEIDGQTWVTKPGRLCKLLPGSLAGQLCLRAQGSFQRFRPNLRDTMAASGLEAALVWIIFWSVKPMTIVLCSLRRSVRVRAGQSPGLLTVIYGFVI